MIVSGTNYSNLERNCSLKLRSEVLAEYSSKNENDFHTNHNLKSIRPNRKSYSQLSKKYIATTLAFLGTLKCANAIERVSIGWKDFRSDLCSLIHVKGCFDAAILRGENLPNIDISSILRHALNKVGISYSPSSNMLSSLHSIGSKEEIDLFDIIGDYTASVFLGITFNKTNSISNITTESFVESLIRDHDNLVDNEAPLNPAGIHDVIGYPFSKYAIVSNVSRKAIIKTIFSRRRPESLDYSKYCPTISKYIPFDKHSASITDLFFMPESNIEPIPEKGMIVVALVLAAVGVLLFTFYAIHNLVKRKSYIFDRRNFTDSNLRRKTSRTICMDPLNGNTRHRHLSKFEE